MKRTPEALAEYRAKRDFTRTEEPEPTLGRGKQRRFVVQKHQASHLHYDFRLELGGTLRSWAVPKGVPFAHAEKRLAVQVEDHPVSYIDFEGGIPAGEYGGGTVMVWDHGHFEPDSSRPLRDLEEGKLRFRLHGEKLSGDYTLVRTARGEGKKQWLLIRSGDSLRPLGARREDSSSLSGRSMKRIAADAAIADQAKPARSATAKTKSAPKTTTAKGTRAPKAPAKRRAGRMPSFLEPMKAKLVSTMPPGDWRYEVKLDGYRAEALLAGARVSLLSRNQKDFGERYPEIVDALAALDLDDSILDGEVVALDTSGHSSFQALQHRSEEPVPVFYYVFDAPRLCGRDLSELPLLERRARLEAELGHLEDPLRLCASVDSELGPLLEQARKLGLEGLIGKRAESAYESGKRSGSWVKLKLVNEQEMVIGGYTDPGGSREHLGALLVGTYDSGGELVYAGKVGSGYTDSALRDLVAKLRKRSRKTCPFVNLPDTRPPGRGVRLTAAEMQRCHWVTPELVCQVRFTEWTRDGRLRHPVFVGLRDDKHAKDVVRERPRR